MNGFVKHKPNVLGRDFVCGDIHGCYSDLEDALARIKFDKSTDRLFSVGDLADRGPESKKALDYIKQPWFFPVLGNHEDMFLQCWVDKIADHQWHFSNGGEWVLELSPEEITEYGRALRDLPLIIQVGNYLVLHSLFPKVEDVAQAESSLEDFREYILWERDRRWNLRVKDIDLIYAGHTIVKEPTRMGCILDIDTGAFLKYWGQQTSLTVLELGKEHL